MSPEEFIDKMIGVPWVNRSSGFDAADCWGLIVLYYRYVMGIEIPVIDDYINDTDFECCFSQGIKLWERIDRPEYGCMVAAYYGRKPIHVGLIFNGRVLHSRGESSSVRMDRLRVFERVYARVEFYRYANN